MNKLYVFLILLISVFISPLSVNAEYDISSFEGYFEYQNDEEESVINGIHIHEDFLEISFKDITNIDENDPYLKLLTDIIKQDIKLTGFTSTGTIDPEKEDEKDNVVLEEPIKHMSIHFSNNEHWDFRTVSIVFNNPRYEIKDNILYISIEESRLMKLQLNDDGNLLENNAYLFSAIKNN